MSARRCPVCLRALRTGACAEHGPWQPHQLPSGRDRRRAERGAWATFEPLTHACPRCLGAVAAHRGEFTCVEHGHDADPHGPFRVDELLGPTAQREAARSRVRLARRARQARTAPRTPVAVALPRLQHTGRLMGAFGIMAATLAFLMR